MIQTPPVDAPHASFGMPLLVVGDGRMGRALVSAVNAAGVDVDGPAARGATGQGARIVLLAVPDASIADAARQIAPGPLVGHLSGSLGLEPLIPHESFSMHPLMTVTSRGADFAGVTAAIDASTDRARQTAHRLATVLGMSPVTVRAEDRAAYHAAASIASNFLITLEDFAERLAATAGVQREALVPLVRASVENWAAQGSRDALTGPVARGDLQTIGRQRAAIEERLPASLALFDALVEATADLASARNPEGAPRA